MFTSFVLHNSKWKILLLIILVGGVIGVAFVLNRLGGWNFIIYGSKEVPCEQLPTWVQAQKIFQEHYDTIKQIENISPGHVFVELRERCSGKGEVVIYYDNPAPLAVDQVTKPPYDFSYDLGTFVGMALPSGWNAVGGIIIAAQVWTQTEQNFEIQFNLSEAFTTHGKGVYTLCLQTEDNFLTTYSVWYEG